MHLFSILFVFSLLATAFGDTFNFEFMSNYTRDAVTEDPVFETGSVATLRISIVPNPVGWGVMNFPNSTIFHIRLTQLKLTLFENGSYGYGAQIGSAIEFGVNASSHLSVYSTVYDRIKIPLPQDEGFWQLQVTANATSRYVLSAVSNSPVDPYVYFNVTKFAKIPPTLINTSFVSMESDDRPLFFSTNLHIRNAVAASPNVDFISGGLGNLDIFYIVYTVIATVVVIGLVTYIVKQRRILMNEPSKHTTVVFKSMP